MPTMQSHNTIKSSILLFLYRFNHGGIYCSLQLHSDLFIPNKHLLLLVVLCLHSFPLTAVKIYMPLKCGKRAIYSVYFHVAPLCLSKVKRLLCVSGIPLSAKILTSQVKNTGYLTLRYNRQQHKLQNFISVKFRLLGSVITWRHICINQILQLGDALSCCQGAVRGTEWQMLKDRSCTGRLPGVNVWKA